MKRMYVLLDTYNTTRCVYPITWNLQHTPRAQHISDYRAKRENKKTGLLLLSQNNPVRASVFEINCDPWNGLVSTLAYMSLVYRCLIIASPLSPRVVVISGIVGRIRGPISIFRISGNKNQEFSETPLKYKQFLEPYFELY
jgi:hypothetical protein